MFCSIRILIQLPSGDSVPIFWDIASNLTATVDFLVSALISVEFRGEYYSVEPPHSAQPNGHSFSVQPRRTHQSLALPAFLFESPRQPDRGEGLQSLLQSRTDDSAQKAAEKARSDAGRDRFAVETVLLGSLRDWFVM